MDATNYFGSTSLKVQRGNKNKYVTVKLFPLLFLSNIKLWNIINLTLWMSLVIYIKMKTSDCFYSLILILCSSTKNIFRSLRYLSWWKAFAFYSFCLWLRFIAYKDWIRIGITKNYHMSFKISLKNLTCCGRYIWNIIS